MSKIAPPIRTISATRRGTPAVAQVRQRRCAAGPERDHAGGDPEQRERSDRHRLEEVEPREPAVLHARRRAREQFVEALRLDPGRRASMALDRRSRHAPAGRSRSSARGCASRASRAHRPPLLTTASTARGTPTGRCGGNPSQRRIAATISPRLCSCGCASSQLDLRRRAGRERKGDGVGDVVDAHDLDARLRGRPQASPTASPASPRSMAVPP